MPILDAYVPEGALTPAAERKLLGTCTDLLLKAKRRREQARALLEATQAKPPALA